MPNKANSLRFGAENEGRRENKANPGGRDGRRIDDGLGMVDNSRLGIRGDEIRASRWRAAPNKANSGGRDGRRIDDGLSMIDDLRQGNHRRRRRAVSRSDAGNKPNFPGFWAENAGAAEKQSQSWRPRPPGSEMRDGSSSGRERGGQVVWKECQTKPIPFLLGPKTRVGGKTKPILPDRLMASAVAMDVAAPVRGPDVPPSDVSRLASGENAGIVVRLSRPNERMS
jgi:hypothetical protein